MQFKAAARKLRHRESSAINSLRTSLNQFFVAISHSADRNLPVPDLPQRHARERSAPIFGRRRRRDPERRIEIYPNFASLLRSSLRFPRFWKGVLFDLDPNLEIE